MIKYNSEYNSILKELCEKNPTSYMNILKSTRFSYLLDYVKSCVSGFLNGSNASFGKMLYWVLHEFQDFPICANPNCHHHVIGRKNIRFNKKWPMYCSNKCAQSDIKTLEHKKQTNTQRYGNPNFNGNHEELKNHNREKYGVDWYFQSREFTAKKQITWEKNGYDHPMHSSHIKEGMKNRFYEKHVVNVMDWLNIDMADILTYPYNQKKLIREFEFYKTKDVSTFTPYVSRKNEIVKYFQQDTFFKVEKEIWKNDQSKRDRLIRNRMRYLNKEDSELTVDDILTGFKKSGLHYGYSHFNPLWFKWFIAEYRIRSCYDPCGGWGHRLLGGLNLEKYIYNDFSQSTKANVDRIIDHFEIENTVTYCNDALTFVPSEDFEAMFTCPPYFNLEKYECGSFLNRNEFDKFISSLFDVFKEKKSCNLFGIVIREDLIGDHTNFIKKILVNPRGESYLDGNIGNFNEYLYVFSKNR